MNIIFRLLIAAGILLLPQFHAGFQPQSISTTILSTGDRQVVLAATRLAGHSPAVAVRWLRHRHAVRSVSLGADKSTINVDFTDGSQVAILPASRGVSHGLPRLHTLQAVNADTTAGNARALVLEPFADELHLGPDAGSDVANSLRSAGFQVDVFRNAAVTVDVMKTLPSYSVVYDETHSGVLSSAGDAVIVVGQPSPSGRPTGEAATLFADHSLKQATVAGDSRGTLYYAVTDTFFAKHVDRFPANSLVFFNGCELLGASRLWKTLQDKGVSTFMSWNAQAGIDADELTAGDVLSHLAGGESVKTAVANAFIDGYGLSFSEAQIARFGYLGDGTNSLQRARNGQQDATATPTSTAPPTPTATPTATTSPPVIRHSHRCKPHHHRSHGRCVKTRSKHKN